MQTHVHHFPSPDKQCEHVHIGITGPLPLCEGYAYLLTCVDRFSGWYQVLPMANTDALTTTKTFMGSWVSRFGVPLPPIRIDSLNQVYSSY